MRKSIILNYDHSWETVSNLTKTVAADTNEDIVYMMVPITEENPIFVVHEILPYMRTFQHAEVEFEGVITHFSTLDEEFMKENPHGAMVTLPPTKISIDTLDQLIECLHSIDRILYCNKLSHSNHDETICYEIMDFCKFKLIIKSDEPTISVNMTLETEKGKFGCREILSAVKKYYAPISKGPTIRFYRDSWFSSLESCTSSDCMNTMFMSLTRSVLLLNGDDLNIVVGAVYSAYCYNLIFWKDEYDKETIGQVKSKFDMANHLVMSNTLRYNSTWSHEVSVFLEYIAYLSCIYRTLLVMADPVSEVPHYEITTRIAIAIYDLGFLEVDSCMDHIVCISDIIQNIRKYYYDKVKS